MSLNIIKHRVNTIEMLLSTPKYYGVEIDIRSYGKELILHHDPFEKGENFSKWLSNYDHGTLILNVKEEGLEESIMDLLFKHKINNYFFLDQSFPFLIRQHKKVNNNSALRFSEYESMESILKSYKFAKWVWVDCFSELPLTMDIIIKMKSLGLNICLVSPELQGHVDPKFIKEFKNKVKNYKNLINAICTKYPDVWKDY